MRKIILFFGFIILIQFSQAEIVPIETAKKIALNFYTSKISEQLLKIHSTDLYISNSYTIEDGNIPILYVFNIAEYGFICISAEDKTFPILTYSFESIYNPKNVIAPFQMWINEYKNQIIQVRKNNFPVNSEVEKSWKSILNNSFTKNITKSVSPFVKSKWDQGKNFNTSCPEDTSGQGGHCVTGCVATCLGQLMYYYRFPDQGIGTFSYTHPVYGNLSVNYFNSTYDWNAMCDVPTKPNSAIGKLIAESGIGVSMNYGPSSSGMYNHSAAYVLRTYFKYPQNVQYIFRDSTTIRWDSLMVAQLDQKMPLYYAGWDIPDTSGHAFVCDGYQDTTYFHFNFGWGGSYDGYFNVNALSPGGSNFNLAQELIINIYPDTSLYLYPNYCNGLKTLTALEGSLEDGSGPIAYYQQNSNCSWLIAPNADSVSSIVLNFSDLKTQSTHGIVKVYNGNTISAPLIGSYSGNTLPSALTVNKSEVLITFTSDNDTIKPGFFINYKTNTPMYCSVFKMLNASSGTFGDGSGGKRYNANTSCKWVIYPSSPAGSVTLHFNNFDTESNKDIIKIKGLSSVLVLATFSGNNIPQDFTLTGNQATLEWTTNHENELQGWEVSYTSSGVGINTIESIQNMIIYPNPTNDILNISMDLNEIQNIKCEIFSMEGKLVYTELWNQLKDIVNKQLLLSNLKSGIYLLQLSNEKHEVSKQKIIVK
jgi:hypothetical protein